MSWPMALLSLLLMNGAMAWAATPETCMRAKVTQQIQEQNKIYLNMGGSGVPTERQALFIPGSSGKVVVLFHGFLASPASMLDLGNQTHLQTGDAIYAPLIFGFGDDDKITNLSTLTQWQNSIRQAIDLASSCYAKIDVAGYSMGAGLLTDFLLHQPEIANSGRYHGSVISQVTLYSPYWLPHPLSLLLQPLVNEMLKSHDSIQVKDLTQIAGREQLVQLLPDFSDHEMIPLRGLATVLKMKNLFLLGNPGTAVLSMPIRVVYSEDDPLIDPRFVPIFTAKHFSNPSYTVYSSGSGIQHRTLQYATLKQSH